MQKITTYVRSPAVRQNDLIDKGDTLKAQDTRTHEEDDLLSIRISDTGRGIPEEKLGRIFDFGFSAGGTRVKMRSGLSTAYSIVQRHRGEIDIESEVGKGTVVTISLPLKKR